MNNPKVKGWRWNRAQNALIADVEIVGCPKPYAVHFPVKQVALDYVQILGDCGVHPEEVGFVDIVSHEHESVDGFLSKVRRSIKRAVKSPVKTIRRTAVRQIKKPFRPSTYTKGIPFEPKALRRARRRVMGRRLRGLEDRYSRHAKAAASYAHRQALRAARSKALGSGLGVAATAFPAVGGPALGAWVVANRYAAYHDQAKALAKQVRGRGRVPPRAQAVIARGMKAKRNFQRLRGMQHDPRARMLLGALRSM